MAENIESRMKFIVEQQAQFAADIQSLKERIRQLVDITFSLARHSEGTDRRMEETDRLMKEFAAGMQELREAGAHSDRRLDALIDVVNKLTSRNGPPT